MTQLLSQLPVYATEQTAPQTLQGCGNHRHRITLNDTFDAIAKGVQITIVR
ncbi:MAG: hypothetical protein PVH37_06385 [Desulfobacterales bacterium]